MTSVAGWPLTSCLHEQNIRNPEIVSTEDGPVVSSRWIKHGTCSARDDVMRSAQLFVQRIRSTGRNADC